MFTFEDLLKVVREYNPEEEEIITKAYYFAEEHFKGKFRDSGEPFITHPLFVAIAAAKLFKADRDMIIACLLHDILEDCPEVTIEEITRLFGLKVAFLVSGVTRDPNFNTGNKEEEQILNEQRMLTFIVQDIRVFLIKILDRIHNLITLDTLKGEEKRQRKAKETLDIYVRLLDAFGMNEIKQYMEDLAFKHYDPKTFEKISSNVEEIRKNSEADLRQALEEISDALAQEGIVFKLEIKTKSINDINRKLKNNPNIDDIHNLLAIKVMVEKEEDCKTALEIINKLYPALNEFSKDYISRPKGNGYQALHITSLLNKNRRIQFRVKTFEMENKSRNGITNYWLAFKGKAPEKMLETLELECEMFQIIKQMVTSYNYKTEDVKKLNIELNI